MSPVFRRYLDRLVALLAKRKDIPYMVIKATLLNCWEEGIDPERSIKQAYKLLTKR